ncbi:PLP-dependent transferase [Gautieria morchelliformis]|nr:PLP-dependent transferase [Gautieria morchelliformis]
MSSSTIVVSNVICPPLGDSIPSALPHAISVSLPTWRDNLGYEEGEKRVLDVMCTGYPRFFIHKSIQKLAVICERKFGLQNEQCILVPHASIANHCREFLGARCSEQDVPPVRLVQFLIHSDSVSSPSSTAGDIALHIVLFPAEVFPVAKQFWQHSGLGISSRMADRCLASLENNMTYTSRDVVNQPPTSPTRILSPSRNKHYSSQGSSARGAFVSSSNGAPQRDPDVLCGDQTTYMEERYGRNMPLTAAWVAKRTLRRRIAGVLAREDESSPTGDDELQPSTRGVEGVTEDDVYLFPTGMAAIWNAHQLCLNTFPPATSVCFGFPYTDTLKILQKWGPGCHFFGNGDEADVDRLESLLSSPEAPRILALFCEFPSNPLLRSANLVRLRELANRYEFAIVIDETIGNFANVELLPYADILVSSLTKVFSGETNVMGGSLILNPRSSYFSELKRTLGQRYEDVYWDEDAIYMERNSRDFAKRVRIINRNAEAVCDLLHSRMTMANSIVKRVYYPKYETRSNYNACRITPPVGLDGQEEGNFGGLFSVTFTSKTAAEAFFDALPCAKGPSLGSNFTLASPYTLLAHFAELEWAATFGVEEGLVRVSVGLEDQQLLISWISHSLRQAEEAVSRSK